MTSAGTDVRGRPAAPPGPPKRSSGASVTSRALILALVAGLLLLTLAVPVRSWFAQRAEIAGLRADVEAARERVAALEVQKERWDDPAFVAAEARRRLHFVLPGEIGFVTLGSEESILADSAESTPDAPWYSTMWGALQQADDNAPASSK